MEIGIWENVKATSERHNDGHLLYTASCKFCGLEIKTRLKDLKKARTCRHLTNGIKNERINRIFNGMIYRCYNSKDKSFKKYGEKGIKVCDEWRNNPKKFEEWSLCNVYASNLTIDRIDCDGDYCPDNCRWITNEDNARYKSTTIIIDVYGYMKTGREWAKELGLGTNIINEYRRRYGYENTVEFIRRALKYGIPKLEHGESYYEKLMPD